MPMNSHRQINKTTIGPVTAIILHARRNEVLCVQRRGKSYLAMWTIADLALAALGTRADGEWTMIAYETLDRHELFHTISGGLSGKLEGYVLNPNTPAETKVQVDTIPMPA